MRSRIGEVQHERLVSLVLLVVRSVISDDFHGFIREAWQHVLQLQVWRDSACPPEGSLNRAPTRGAMRLDLIGRRADGLVAADVEVRWNVG